MLSRAHDRFPFVNTLPFQLPEFSPYSVLLEAVLKLSCVVERVAWMQRCSSMFMLKFPSQNSLLLQSSCILLFLALNSENALSPFPLDTFVGALAAVPRQTMTRFFILCVNCSKRDLLQSILWNMADVYDKLYKVILLGDAGVGKSSLLQRYINGTYDPEKQPYTVGADFRSKMLVLPPPPGTRIKLQLWDVSGSDEHNDAYRFRPVDASYYRGALCVVLCYDVSCKDSLDHLERWLRESREATAKERTTTQQQQLFVLANKCDLEPAVKQELVERGEAYAQSVGAVFVGVSAKSGENVEETFSAVAEAISRGTSVGMQPGAKRRGVAPPPKPEEKPRSRCCVS